VRDGTVTREKRAQLSRRGGWADSWSRASERR
jgi:hypothetical protein